MERVVGISLSFNLPMARETCLSSEISYENYEMEAECLSPTSSLSARNGQNLK